MTEWLAADYPRIRDELADITPMRSGVPYADGLTQVWHYVFGAANRRLVEVGLFADPYEVWRKYKGFIPMVWRPGINKFQ
jgi:hypothetical protein